MGNQNGKPASNNDSEKKWITPSEIINFVEKQRKTVLIIDSRPLSKYNIAYKNRSIEVLQLEPKKLREVKEFDDLKKFVSPVEVLYRIDRFDFVVLMDQVLDNPNTNEASFEKLEQFLEIIDEFNLKHRPLLLKGGFKAWKIAYEMYVSERPKEQSSNSLIGPIDFSKPPPQILNKAKSTTTAQQINSNNQRANESKKYSSQLLSKLKAIKAQNGCKLDGCKLEKSSTCPCIKALINMSNDRWETHKDYVQLNLHFHGHLGATFVEFYFIQTNERIRFGKCWGLDNEVVTKLPIYWTLHVHHWNMYKKEFSLTTVDHNDRFIDLIRMCKESQRRPRKVCGALEEFRIIVGFTLGEISYEVLQYNPAKHWICDFLRY